MYCYDDILNMIKAYTPVNTIFDIGCGLGAFTNRLSKLATRTVGFDISSVAINRAKSRFPNLEFQCLDLAQNIPNEQADLVIVNEVLYYQDVMRRGTMLENIAKIAKKYVVFGYYVLDDYTDLLHKWITMYFDVISKQGVGHIILLTKKKKI